VNPVRAERRAIETSPLFGLFENQWALLRGAGPAVQASWGSVGLGHLSGVEGGRRREGEPFTVGLVGLRQEAGV